MQLPRFLQVLLVAFGLIPVWSALTLGAPWQLVASGATLASVLKILAYWILPLGICLGILLRTHLLIFAFMTECVALLADAALAPSPSPAVSLVRLVLLAGVAVLGVAFVYRDVSMPFFAGKKRGFRRAARLRVNVGLRLATTAGAERSAEMEDCSLVGMSFAVAGEGGAPPYAKGDRLEVKVRLDQETLSLPATVAWCVRDELLFRVGISTIDVTTMSRVIAGVTMQKVPAPTAYAMKMLARTSVSRAALATWLVAFGGSAAVPACGSDSSFSSSTKKAAERPSHKTKVDDGADKDKDEDNDNDNDTKGGGSKSVGGKVRPSPPDGSEAPVPQAIIEDGSSSFVEEPPETEELTIEVKDDVTAAVDASCSTDAPATTTEPATDDKKEIKKAAGQKQKVRPKAVFLPKESLPPTVPDECRDGIEFNRLSRGSILIGAAPTAVVGGRPLEVDIATYLAPDHIRMIAIEADGKRTVVLDTCRIQTATYADPTRGAPQRPPEESIREFRTQLPAKTVRLELDFTDAASPTYIRVIGLCGFALDAATITAAKKLAIGVLDAAGNTLRVVTPQPD